MKRITLLLTLILAMAATASAVVTVQEGWYRIRLSDNNGGFNYVQSQNTTSAQGLMTVAYDADDDQQLFYFIPLTPSSSSTNYNVSDVNGFYIYTKASGWNTYLASSTGSNTHISLYEHPSDADYLSIKFDAYKYWGTDSPQGSIWCDKSQNASYDMWQLDQVYPLDIPAEGGWYRIKFSDNTYVYSTGDLTASPGFKKGSTGDSDDQKFFIVPNSDGISYTVQDRNGLYLTSNSSANSWTSALASSSTDTGVAMTLQAHYSDASWISIRYANKGTYWGCDSSGDNIYTDKDLSLGELSMWQIETTTEPDPVTYDVNIPEEGGWYRIMSYAGNYMALVDGSLMLDSYDMDDNGLKFYIVPVEGGYKITNGDYEVVASIASATTFPYYKFFTITVGDNSLANETDAVGAAVSTDVIAASVTNALWIFEETTEPEEINVTYPIVINGDFEDTDYTREDDDKVTYIPGWTIVGNNDYYNELVNIVTEDADTDDANNYLKVTTYQWNSWGANTGVSQVVNLEKGTVYTLSYLVNHPKSDRYYTVKLTDSNGNDLYTTGNRYTSTSGWELVNYDFTATTKVATLQLIQQIGSSNGNITVAFDDIAIVPYYDEVNVTPNYTNAPQVLGNYVNGGTFQNLEYQHSIPSVYTEAPYCYYNLFNGFYSLNHLEGWVVCDNVTNGVATLGNGKSSENEDDSDDYYIILQGNTTGSEDVYIKQTVTGLTVDQQYYVTYDVNHPEAIRPYNVYVQVNGSTIGESTNLNTVTDGWATEDFTFTATAEEVVLFLSLNNRDYMGNQETTEPRYVSFDNVSVTEDQVYSSLSTITVDDAIDAAPVYYNLQGIRVATPTRGQVYIMTRGAKSTKVVY